MKQSHSPPEMLFSGIGRIVGIIGDGIIGDVGKRLGATTNTTENTGECAQTHIVLEGFKGKNHRH